MKVSDFVLENVIFFLGVGLKQRSAVVYFALSIDLSTPPNILPLLFFIAKFCLPMILLFYYDFFYFSMVTVCQQQTPHRTLAAPVVILVAKAATFRTPLATMSQIIPIRLRTILRPVLSSSPRLIYTFGDSIQELRIRT